MAVFIYWGWDSTVTVNEETENSTETPGKAALWATVILVLLYVVDSVAAQAYHGAAFLSNNSDDVFKALGGDVLGSPWDKLLIIAVLTSASASTQTTILPTARTSLSMAAHGAIPQPVREHPSPLPDAVDLDDLHGRRCRSSGTSASRSSASRSCSRRSPASG